MNQFKRCSWLLILCLLYISKAKASNDFKANKSNNILIDTVKLLATSTTGQRNDVVTIAVKVSNFINVGKLTYSLTWNNTLLEYVSHVSLYSGQSFDLSKKNDGGLGLTWNVRSDNWTLPDDAEIMQIQLRIIGCSGNPTGVNFFSFPTPIEIEASNPRPLRVATQNGRVIIQNGNGCNLSRSPGEICSSAPLLCPDEFPYKNALTRTTPGTIVGPAYCSTIENNVWLAFIAGSKNIDFRFSASNCTGQGLQAAVLQTDDCVNFPPLKDPNTDQLFCQRQIDDGTFKILSCTNLTVGKKYYIMVDGYFGSQCDFEISINAGSVIGTATNTLSINGPNKVCTNADNLSFSVSPDTSNVSEYQWKVGTDAVIKSGQGTPSVIVKWGTVSDDICVKTIGRCGESDWSCKTLNILSSPDKTIDTTICQGSSVVVNGLSYSLSGNYVINLPGQAQGGCDSTIKLNLTVFDFSVTAAKSGDIPCDNSAVTVSSTVNNPQNGSLSYEWRNEQNTIISTAASFSTTNSGTFTLTVTAVKNGARCTKTASITVSKSGSFPAKPQMSGVLSSCLNQTDVYQINNPAEGISQYNWIVTGGIVASQTATSANINWTASATNKVCVTAENGCGVSDTICVSVIVGIKPDLMTITGSETVCPGAKATYNASAASNNIENYVWGVPAGATIIKGAGTPSIDIDWGSSAGGKITLTPKNSCGDAPMGEFTVTVKSEAPKKPEITGVKTVCSNDTATFSITPDAAITAYEWQIPVGVTALTPINTSSVKLKFGTTNASIGLKVQNACNLTNTNSYAVEVNNVVPDSVPILGNKTVCSNDTTVYTITPTSAVNAYNWQVSNGARILKGQNTNRIEVVWGTNETEQLVVEMKNGCNQTRKVSLNIAIKKADLGAPTIVGSKQVCPGTIATYKIASDPQITEYVWTKSSNGTIQKGQGTHEIDVKFADIGTSDVCIQIKNGCAVTRGACFPVEVKNSIDSLPIIGDTQICENGIGVFKVQKDPNASNYLWFPPAGATIVAGFQGKDSVKVQFGGSGGILRVSPSGGCADGTFSRLDVKIKSKPALPANITGKTQICENDTATFSIPAVAGATSYEWDFPAGVKIVKGDKTNSIVVQWQTPTSGFISVKAKNDCGESLPVQRNVTVRAVPKPNAGVDATVCGTNHTLKASGGVGTIKWSVLSKPANSVATFQKEGELQTGVNVSKTGIYTFAISISAFVNGSCGNTDTVVLNFKQNPTVRVVADDCNSSSTAYQLSLIVENATPPLSSSGSITGTFTNLSFKSDNIANNTPYWIKVTDADGCSSDTLSGVKRCPCQTNAGVLLADSMVVCYGEKAKLPASINPKLDGNDTFEYILHEGTKNAIGKVLARNKTGEFVFDTVTMKANTVYYAHYVVGDSDGDRVGLTANCTQLSNAIPIIFKDKMTVGFTGDTVICSGTNATFKFKTIEPDIFKITYTDGVSTFNKINITNNALIAVTPSVTTVYKLIEAVNLAGCKASVGDSVKISMRSKPIAYAGADTSICSDKIVLSGIIPSKSSASWRGPAGVNIVSPTRPQTEVLFLKDGRNNFILTVKDSICPTQTSVDTVAIFSASSPQANNYVLKGFLGDTISMQLNDGAPKGTYEVTRLTNPKEGYFELFSDGKFNFIANIGRPATVSFRYMSCSATCSNLCDTGEVRIILQEKPKVDTLIQVDIPNAITPNSDNKNDMWVINNLEKFPGNELIVFNRWGDILYKAKPYNNDWEGTNQNGQPLPEGTYYYVLRLNINDGKVLKGDITILR
jgi:gliding motility-associated-like protein